MQLDVIKDFKKKVAQLYFHFKQNNIHGKEYCIRAKAEEAN
jgi:hypothetical protein